MRDLPGGMDARIRAAGALQFHAGRKVVFCGLAQLTGYGVGVALLLPAAESRAVIFERELPGSHTDCGRRSLRRCFAVDPRYAFFAVAQRFLCAAAILARVSALNFRLLRRPLGPPGSPEAAAAFGGRPLRPLPNPSNEPTFALCPSNRFFCPSIPS